jgi:hypothetical protein
MRFKIKITGPPLTDIETKRLIRRIKTSWLLPSEVDILSKAFSKIHIRETVKVTKISKIYFAMSKIIRIFAK